MKWIVLSGALLCAALITSPASAKSTAGLAGVKSACTDEFSAARRRVCSCRYVGKRSHARRLAGPGRPGTIRAIRY